MHVHEPHEYKIVMDEVVLGGTALAMHESREVAVPARAYEFGGSFDTYGSFVDKRPLFFPFVVSLVHDLTGYRVSNAMWLNVALTPVFLGLVFALAARLTGARGAGYAALALISTLPLLAQNFTSHGFECLNVTMIVLVVWLGCRLLEKPEDEDRLASFVLAGVLLVQTRYESALFVLPVGALVLLAWFRIGRVSLPFGLMVAPLLLLPVPWLQNVFKLNKASWQLSDIEGAQAPFGFGYFYDNVGYALAHYLDFSGSEPNSALLFMLGAACAAFVLVRIRREQRVIFRGDSGAVIVFWCALAAHTFLMLCYFWGRFNDPIVRRLSLPSYLWLLLSILLVWHQLVKDPRRWRFLTCLAAGWLVVFTGRAVAQSRWTQENFAARTNAWLGRWLDSLPEGTHAFAIDPGSSLVWIQHRQSAIGIGSLQAAPEKFLYHWKQGTWKDQVYLLQRLGTDWKSSEGIPILEENFGKSFTLETVEERFFTPLYRIRLSRVTEVDEAKFLAAMESRKKLVPISQEHLKAEKKAEQTSLQEWFIKLP